MAKECKHICCGETCHREPPKEKLRQPLRRTAIKRRIPQKNEKDEELEKFFDDCIQIVAKNPYCSECYAWISPNLYRFAVAHILAKKIFPSIKAHPLNWLKLGSTCGCHDRSHRLDTFSKMKVFEVAVEKFKIFEKDIKESNKILSSFRDYANIN